MVAQIAGFRTRAQLGLRKPRSFSRRITPQNGGAAVHWGGPRQAIATHAQCEATWRAWQDYHMDGHGWVDIAYTMGFCNHGYVFAGRGFHVRTAANGTNEGNQSYYAFVWIGGKGQKPTPTAYNALDWCLWQGQVAGGAGNRVRPHSDFTGSSCPGPDHRAFSRLRDRKKIPLNVVTPTPEPEPEPEPVDDWEEFMATLSNAQKQKLHDLSAFLVEESVAGDTFARSLLEQFRTINTSLERLQDENGKGPSMQSVIIGSINTIDAVRDQGYEISTQERTGPIQTVE